jgi:hypothetical protein
LKEITSAFTCEAENGTQEEPRTSTCEAENNFLQNRTNGEWQGTGHSVNGTQQTHLPPRPVTCGEVTGARCEEWVAPQGVGTCQGLCALGPGHEGMHDCMTHIQHDTARAAPEGRKLERTRRPGPWRVLELFTWTCMVSLVAAQQGWEFLEPVTLPRFDIQTWAGRKKAWNYIREADPDFIMSAWPCGPWSRMQQINQRNPQQIERLREKRRNQREVLMFVWKVTRWQKARGRVHAGENPEGSLAWKEDPIRVAYEGEGDVITHACRWGKKRPDTGMLIRKPTRIRGTKEICQEVNFQCRGGHEHSPLEGRMRNEQGKSVPATEWAGGYAPAFARALIKGAEKGLIARGWSTNPSTEVYVAREEGVEDTESDEEQPGVNEERFMRADEDDMGEDDECMPPDLRTGKDVGTPREIREAVRKAHNGLGHPDRKIMLRMMKLSGASPAAVQFAKEWNCPVRQARKAPSRTSKAAGTVRPFGFNRTVYLDLKFYKNCKKQKFVAMSVVCAGTSWQLVTLLKTRQASYVAKKFVKHWVASFGAPDLVVHDQGGEFGAVFSEMFEEYNISSRVAGAHAGWQVAMGERHGGIHATMATAIIHEQQVESREDMALSLACASQAKNSLMKRNGHSPEQGVFGRALRLVGGNLADDDDAGLAALDAQGEAARATRMRATASHAFLRLDVQDKLRRALTRAPTKATSNPAMLPGTQVYFWEPGVGKGRLRADPGRWRGPALVISADGETRYYLSWRGKILLAAREQLRLASAEEAAAFKHIARDAAMTGSSVSEEPVYEDYTAKEEPPPAERKKKNSRLYVRTRQNRRLTQKWTAGWKKRWSSWRQSGIERR